MRLLLSFLLLISAVCAAPSVAPVELRCEFRTDPIGIGETKPRLSWKLTAVDTAARGLSQSAWQVLVSSSPETLAQNRGDFWDSGQVASAATNNIVYAGHPLVSRVACWWKVRVWDQAGEASAWSAPAHWTMGLLDGAQWSAEWIGLDAARPDDGSVMSEERRVRITQLPWMRAELDAAKDAPLPDVFMRKAFTLPAGRKVARATIVLTPDMRCVITTNGHPIGEVTRWDRALPLDITTALEAGENVVGLRVTQDDGYPPAVLGELEAAFDEGEPMRLPIDATWLHASKNASAGWDRPGFDATAWRPLAIIFDKWNPGGFGSPWGSPQNATHWLAPASFLRRSFSVTKAVRRATIYATALGIYEIQLNGKRVGRDFLTPGWTEYTRRLQHQTYDVTAQLHRGTNALGAILGDGWFAGVAAYTGKRHYYGGAPRLRAQLEIEYADGTRDLVATDGTWRGKHGALRYADIYLGSAWDARLAQPDWARPDFDDRSWQPVATRLAPGSPDQFVLEPATLEPVRAQEELPARTVMQPRPGAYVFDLGQNMVGWVRLKVHGRAGQRLVVRHGEMLNPNGTLYTSNLRGATATDVYWLRGEGEEVLEPWGTFHGFRYVEITGLDAAPEASAVTGVVVHNPMNRAGDFTCSQPLVNQLFRNIIWGQKGNYIETATDCPQRDERLGWTGDTQFFMRTALYNYDAAAFVERWLTTLITDSQGEDGTFPDVAPAIGMKPHGVTAWGDAALSCTYMLWKVYGDTRVVERHFDRLARYIAWLQGRAVNGIVSVGGYGDWLNKGGGAKKEVMDTAYYAYLCGLMSEMATAIGRDADAARFAALRQEVVAAWRREFLQPDGGILESSQTGFALAFTMGLLPDALKTQAADLFADDIEAKGWHLATGFIGTPRLLPALHAAGRDDIACRLLLQDTYPSWLYQVKLGATTMWERWDGWTPKKGFQSIGMNSFNHYAFGAVAEYLYRFIGGIDTEGPGFRRILIAPQPGNGLTHANTSYDGPTGLIASSWKISDGKFSLDVTVPPNTTATVRMPAADAATVRESARTVGEAVGVKFLRMENGAAIFRTGSGQYHFAAPAPGDR
ncbi:MAG: family 78 glycoside hydrolase catalytic domain [Opitutaceae bacterium]